MQQVIDKSSPKIHYVDSKRSGYRRKTFSGSFIYINTRGKRINDPRTLGRIKSLVIPPGWKNVWICPDSKGHIQATGLDDKSRKQYIYHSGWQKLRQETKFELLLPFGKGLPVLRKRVADDLARSEMNLQKVCALAIEIMDITSIRPGRDNYQRENGSYGLTTLNKRHLHQHSRNAFFVRFRGKRGIRQEKILRGKRLSRLLQKVREIPSQRLFQYFDAQGRKYHLDSGHLNEYLRQTLGVDATCKTFRTWNACMATLNHFIESFSASTSDREFDIHAAIDAVATELGNTHRVAKLHYILPQLLAKYRQGQMDDWLAKMQDVSRSKREERCRRYFLEILQR